MQKSALLKIYQIILRKKHRELLIQAYLVAELYQANTPSLSLMAHLAIALITGIRPFPAVVRL